MTAGIAVIVLAFIAAYLSGIIYIAALPLALVGLLFLLSDIRLALFLCVLSFPFAINPVEMGRGLMSIDLPDEPLMLLMTAAFPFIIYINRKHTIFKQIFSTTLGSFMVIWWLWTVICTFYSTDIVLSIKYTLAKTWYIVPFVYITALVVYFDTAYIIRLYKWLVGISFLIVLYVIYRHAGLGYAFEKVSDASFPFFRNHVIYGSYVAALFPLITVVLFYTRRFTLRWWILLTMAVVVIIAVYLSYSRAAWASILFSGGVILLTRLKSVQYFFIIFYLALSGGLLFMATDNKYIDFAPKFEHGIMHDNLVDHLIATIKGRDISSNERFYRWVAAVRMSKERPITGCGPNTFYYNYKSYTVSIFRTWVSRNLERSTTHNYFLFMLAEQGYVGIILYALLILLLFYQAQRIFHSTQNITYRMITLTVIGMEAVNFINNFFSELLEVDKIGGLFYIGIGILIALQIKIKSENSSTQHGNKTIS